MDRVLLLGPVQEQGSAYAVPHHVKGLVRELPAQSGSARHIPACSTPACLIADIFVLTGDIGGWGPGKGRAGRGERPQEPKRQQEGRRRIREVDQGQRRGDEQRDGGSNKDKY